MVRNGCDWKVVEGETPFLLSNAFLKAVAADVCTSTHELKLFHGVVSVGLKVNRKGLFLIELSEILEAVMSQTADLKADCEVVTALIEEKTKKTIEGRRKEEQNTCRQQSPQTTPTTAARVVQTSSKLTAHNSKKEIQYGQEEQSLLRGDGSFQSRSTTGLAGGSEFEQHRDGRCEDREASRDSESTPIRRSETGRWQTPREDVQSSGGWRYGLCPLHDEQERLHLGLGLELPQLCPGQRSYGEGLSDANHDTTYEQCQPDPCGESPSQKSLWDLVEMPRASPEGMAEAISPASRMTGAKRDSQAMTETNTMQTEADATQVASLRAQIAILQRELDKIKPPESHT